MKKRLAILGIFSVVMLQCVSCHRQLDNEYEFEVHSHREDPFAPVVGDSTATPHDTLGVKLSVDITLFKEVKHLSQLHTINAFLMRSALGNDYHEGMSADKAIAAYCVARHREFDTTLAQVGNPVYRSTFHWFYDIISAPVTVADEFVVYQQTDYVFTGGAHPNHSTQYYTLSLQTGRRLTEKNFFNLTAANKKSIEQLLLKKMEQYCDRFQIDTQNVHIQSPTLNGNFLIKESSLVFHYNPYELAPYVVGDIELEIPSYELHDYLNPEAPLSKYWFKDHAPEQ